MKALCCLAAALLASPAVPQTVQTPVATGPGTRFYDGPPPARFIREGIVPVLFVDPARLAEACGAKVPPGLALVACTRMTKSGVKVVIMPHPAVAMKTDYYALVLAHELAHALANWPGDHPL